MTPTSLNHAHVGIHEEMDCALEEVGGRNEIGVEDGDEFACGGLQSLLQCARFVAVTIASVPVFDIKARSTVLVTEPLRINMRFVSGIIEHLNLEQFAGIFQFCSFFEQPLHYKAFVVER